MRCIVLCLMISLPEALPASGSAVMTAKDLVSAQKIYESKCAKCHRFYEPRDYAEPDWQTWMEKMNKKSKLKADQAALLRRFLDGHRRGQWPLKETKGKP